MTSTEGVDDEAPSGVDVAAFDSATPTTEQLMEGITSISKLITPDEQTQIFLCVYEEVLPVILQTNDQNNI